MCALCSRIVLGRGASDGDRTRIPSLEGWYSAIELRPQMELAEGLEPPTLILQRSRSTN